MLYLSMGRVARAGAALTAAAVIAGVPALRLIPGSRSLLGVVDLGPGFASDNGAAILHYTS